MRRRLHRDVDRAVAPGDLDDARVGHAGGAGEHRGADVGGVLGSRVVVGDHHDVGAARSGLAHRRALVRVTVAAAPSTTITLPRTPSRAAATSAGDGVGRVRVVDEREQPTTEVRVATRSIRPGTPSQAAMPSVAVSGSTPADARSARAPSALATLNSPGSADLERQVAGGRSVRARRRTRPAPRRARRRSSRPWLRSRTSSARARPPRREPPGGDPTRRRRRRPRGRRARW